MMVTKVPDFVSTMSRNIKCNHCSKLLEKKINLLSSRGLFTMSDYKALDINIEARVKPPEVISHQKGVIGSKLLEWMQNVFFILKKKNSAKEKIFKKFRM